MKKGYNMTSKNFNRVLAVVVNKLNKCYFNFTKPEDMKSVTIEKSTFLVEHELGLQIDDNTYLYITIDGNRMYEIDLHNEVKDSNELFNRVQYLLALAYGGIYNGEYDELVEHEETDETEEATEIKETTEAEEIKKVGEPTVASKEAQLVEDVGNVKKKSDPQAYNSMCYNCKKFLNGCRGEKNKIYSGCVYKEKMEVRNNG